MIRIARNKIFYKTVLQSLRNALQLKMSLEDSYNLGNILEVLNQARTASKTMFSNQVAAWGGEIDHRGNKKYKFKKPDKPKGSLPAPPTEENLFEVELEDFLSKDQIFNNIDPVEVTLLKNNISDLDKLNLVGIVSFISEVNSLLATG